MILCCANRKFVLAARLTAAQKGRGCDESDASHKVICQIMDFVCGAQSPPMPAPKTYMEETLAQNMTPFQSQMTLEVLPFPPRAAFPPVWGLTERCGVCTQVMDKPSAMQTPIHVTFWEMGRHSRENPEPYRGSLHEHLRGGTLFGVSH